MTKKPKLISSIRAKLVSAVAMLLVAMIMVVSSTYAWFTLSTAPEVTGISTQIGANGALEMALNTGLTNGPLNGQVEAGDDENTYWGNLVNLDKTAYGLKKITLLPSKLTVTKGENGAADTFAATGFLQTPVYGADGRVKELKGNAVAGVYNETAFYANDAFGVRGLGTASGMTDRELAYSNAASAASTLMGKAKSGASASLNTNGAVLANVAVKHGTTSDGSDTYTQDDIDAMIAICDDLLGTDTKAGVLENIEKAYLQYILQYAAGANGGEDDTLWQAVQSAVEIDNATIDSVVASLGGVTLPDTLTDIFAKLKATKTTVANAKTTLEALNTGSYVWGDFSGALASLCDTENIQVNGHTVSWIKQNEGVFAQDVMTNGITVTMATGGGVYADVADHCGDYKASIALDIKYGTTEFKDFPANMNTNTSVDPVYLNQVAKAVKLAGPFVGTSTADKPLTEFYGYIIDLSFRTNAANSSLLLQTTATDRIYDDKTENNDTTDVNNTWGRGSTMTFESSSNSFTMNMMKSLMENIKIVFFTPGTGENSVNTILAYAVLDANGATASTDGKGLTANIYLLDDAGQMIKTQEDADILALTQNAIHNVSVLVYLDGENLENADVAADAATSMTGKMNLQFSSSATLDPMEYADLHPQSSTTNP